jgi:UDP-N-acetylmuramoyl-tripeptide--D-alanyl-D-alanine ligase
MGFPDALYTRLLEAPDVVIDSRKVSAGSLFFALRGSQVDGNAYAADAVERGAAAVVVDQPQIVPSEEKEAEAYYLVPDVLATMQALATHHRQQLGIPVIGIGGSNGKTTTRALVTQVLQQAYRVHATPGNWNNHIGLPLTLLHLRTDHDLAVLELGANQPGEYAELCQIAQPNYGLITNIGLDHLEGYGDFQGVMDAHAEITTYLRERQGLLFLNAEDQAVVSLRAQLPTVSYGTDSVRNAPQPDFQGTITQRLPALSVAVQDLDGTRLTEVCTQLYGSYNFSNVMAAIAIGYYFNLSTGQVKAGIEAYQPENNRSQVISYNRAQVILDAYNANPTSMAEAMADFEALPATCRLAILGDMYELGRYAMAEHQRIVAIAAGYTFQAVFVGGYFYQVREGYSGTFFQDMEQLQNWWQQQSLADCWVLLKGSRGLALERLLA